MCEFRLSQRACCWCFSLRTVMFSLSLCEQSISRSNHLVRAELGQVCLVKKNVQMSQQLAKYPILLIISDISCETMESPTLRLETTSLPNLDFMRSSWKSKQNNCLSVRAAVSVRQSTERHSSWHLLFSQGLCCHTVIQRMTHYDPLPLPHLLQSDHCSSKTQCVQTLSAIGVIHAALSDLLLWLSRSNTGPCWEEMWKGDSKEMASPSCELSTERKAGNCYFNIWSLFINFLLMVIIAVGGMVDNFNSMQPEWHN